MITACVVAVALFAAWRVHLFVLLITYWAVMTLQRQRDNGGFTPRGERWAKRALYFGLALDLSYNWSWAIVEFLDIPREPLVTARLKRYKYGTATTRLAQWRLRKTNDYALDFLDWADPSGKHV